MKLLNILFAVLFATFAIVQFNDESGSFNWILTYFIFGAIAVFAAFGRYSRPILLIAMAGSLIGTGVLMPGLIEFLTNQDNIPLSAVMDDSKPYIEEARECGGLIISFAIMGVFLWQARRLGKG